MIELDKNYKIDTDNTHGFKLLFEGDPEEKEVETKQGKEIRMVSPTDTWYYPKLSQVLFKYFSLSLAAQDSKKLIDKVRQVESNISRFSKTFAKRGKTFTL